MHPGADYARGGKVRLVICHWKPVLKVVFNAKEYLLTVLPTVHEPVVFG